MADRSEKMLMEEVGEAALRGGVVLRARAEHYLEKGSGNKGDETLVGLWAFRYLLAPHYQPWGAHLVLVNSSLLKEGGPGILGTQPYMGPLGHLGLNMCVWFLFSNTH